MVRNRFWFALGLAVAAYLAWKAWEKARAAAASIAAGTSLPNNGPI